MCDAPAQPGNSSRAQQRGSAAAAAPKMVAIPTTSTYPLYACVSFASSSTDKVEEPTVRRMQEAGDDSDNTEVSGWGS